ncbi:putative Serine/threonine-protein kinase RUNKEL [Paratrimastix pyriformis]|uniref:Serine/threonine-protein kinase RUNKEL n=1 Tax=Paratrimastix pyriformis TaxID=342808 RepID=A0ABQ8UVW9_9EUKA|nr:putative Serine/threonine-protein kinase RUNKEL [Paratrimastix pyriformis]
MQEYHVFDEIGKGKHSTSYLGRKKQTIQYCAVKSVEKSQKDFILNEVRIMHNLDHTNVLKFVNWYETGNHIWLIIEYCSGGDLKKLLVEDGKLPEQSVRAFSADIRAGLQYLHSRGIIYADLCPSTVLFTGTGTLKLCDFKQSMRIVDIKQPVLRSRHRTTMTYLAPELLQPFPAGAADKCEPAEGGAGTGHSAPYSMHYELIEGKPPFQGSTPAELIEAICTKDFTMPASVSLELCDLLMGLLQKDPNARISWADLGVHPFWRHLLYQLPLPAQPAMDPILEQLRDHRITMQHAVLPPPQPAAPAAQPAAPAHEALIVHRLQQQQQQQQPVSARPGSGRTADVASTLSTPAYRLLLAEHAHHEQHPAHPPTAAFGEEAVGAPEGGAEGSSGPRAAQHEGTGEAPGEAEEDEEMAIQGTTNYAGMAPLQLVWHDTDFCVYPIAMNRKIEKLPKPFFDEAATPLGFPPLSAQQLEALQQAERNQYLGRVVRCLLSPSLPSCLSYLETLATDSTTASTLLNSETGPALVNQLKQAKSTQLRAQLCTLFAVLVRYARSIDTVVLRAELPDCLAALLRDKSEKVRRAACSALGELLYYAASQNAAEQQQQQGGADSGWTISTVLVGALLKCLRKGEDEIVRHYATKAIENMAMSHYAPKSVCLPVVPVL